ncbi:hypothetical protein EUX53_09680 [Pseudomonas orientalis]|nr:hypothetical protein EUX53_09680 [Pseudomonas orientalis]
MDAGRYLPLNVGGGLFVGASLLAKNSQAPRSFRKHALSLTFFASKLAPTEDRPPVCLKNR